MRLIDADKLKDVPMFNGKYDKENANENFIFGIETVFDFINELQTVDAVPVIRCKDCKHFYDHAIRIHGCEQGECDIIGATIEPDWFCADGEKKR